MFRSHRGSPDKACCGGQFCAIFSSSIVVTGQRPNLYRGDVMHAHNAAPSLVQRKSLVQLACYAIGEAKQQFIFLETKSEAHMCHDWQMIRNITVQEVCRHLCVVFWSQHVRVVDCRACPVGKRG